MATSNGTKALNPRLRAMADDPDRYYAEARDRAHRQAMADVRQALNPEPRWRRQLARLRSHQR